METVQFRFYAQLNDFLAPEKQHRNYITHFNAPQSVKHLIESEGVPHPEVAMILANGKPVQFEHLAQDCERIAVYPLLHSITLTPTERLRPPLPRPPAFVLDNHLGKLARYMRLLGFDTLYPEGHPDDEQLAQIAHEQGRVMLTRDRRLLMRKLIEYGYCLRSTDSRQQLIEVLDQFDLRNQIQPWLRCLKCNGLLKRVAKEEIIDQLEPKTKKYYSDFRQCQDCGQVYWKGSHFEKLERFINSLFEGAVPPAEN